MTVAVSTVILLIIAAGLVFRRNRKVHIPVMLTAFVLDLALVAYIEFNRHAVAQALEGPEGLLRFHIADSVLVVLLYGALIASGVGWMRGKPWAIRSHRWLAAAFLLCRLVNYVTSWYL